MRKQYPLFVGYFKRDVNKNIVVGFLKEHCPDLRFIDLYKCNGRNTGKCYCCKLTFDSKVSLVRAGKILGKRKIKGRSMVVRNWKERTAANERRDVNWRKISDDNRDDKRRKDRRRYHEPETLYVKQ